MVLTDINFSALVFGKISENKIFSHDQYTGWPI